MGRGHFKRKPRPPLAMLFSARQLVAARLKRLCFGLGLMKLKMGVCFTSYPLRQQSTPCIRGLAIAFQARENLSECFTAGQLTICIRKCCRTILPTAFVLRRRQELARSWPMRCTTRSVYAPLINYSVILFMDEDGNKC